MKRFLIILLAVLVVTFAGCKFGRGIAGSGNRKTEKRDLKSFNAIDTSGAYDVKITCQKPASFEIEADDNILPLIKTEVRDGVLFVSFVNAQPSCLGALLTTLSHVHRCESLARSNSRSAFAPPSPRPAHRSASVRVRASAQASRRL